MARFIFSWQFVVFFLRSFHLIRLVVICLVYLIMPLDLFPEGVVGLAGYIDDILLTIFFLVLFISIAAIPFMLLRQ